MTLRDECSPENGLSFFLVGLTAFPQSHALSGAVLSLWSACTGVLATSRRKSRAVLIKGKGLTPSSQATEFSTHDVGFCSGKKRIRANRRHPPNQCDHFGVLGWCVLETQPLLDWLRLCAAPWRQAGYSRFILISLFPAEVISMLTPEVSTE